LRFHQFGLKGPYQALLSARYGGRCSKKGNTIYTGAKNDRKVKTTIN